MSLADYELYQPKTVGDALECAARLNGDSAFIAGGTDLLPSPEAKHQSRAGPDLAFKNRFIDKDLFHFDWCGGDHRFADPDNRVDSGSSQSNREDDRRSGTSGSRHGGRQSDAKRPLCLL